MFGYPYRAQKYRHDQKHPFTNSFRVASAAVQLETWKFRKRRTALDARPTWGALKALLRWALQVPELGRK